MAPQTLTHTGSMTGYQPVGDEVRAGAGVPKRASAMNGAQFRQPFTADQEPLGTLGEGAEKHQKQPELPEYESDEQDNGWRYRATVQAPGPAYGGAVWNDGGGDLANMISGTKPLAIESAAPKIIAGAVEL